MGRPSERALPERMSLLRRGTEGGTGGRTLTVKGRGRPKLKPFLCLDRVGLSAAGQPVDRVALQETAAAASARPLPPNACQQGATMDETRRAARPGAQKQRARKTGSCLQSTAAAGRPVQTSANIAAAGRRRQSDADGAIE